VFKKFLSATKNKIKTPPHIKMNGGGPGTSSMEDDEEFEARKHEWQVHISGQLEVFFFENLSFTRKKLVAKTLNYA